MELTCSDSSIFLNGGERGLGGAPRQSIDLFSKYNLLASTAFSTKGIVMKSKKTHMNVPNRAIEMR